jgi:hypothetical protein
VKRHNWQIMFILSLIIASFAVYLIHFLIFRDVHHIFLYLIGDIAFVFIQVLLVSLILQKILDERSKEAMLSKLNMVIGAFFSEAGSALLRILAEHDNNSGDIREELTVNSYCLPQDFDKIKAKIKAYDYSTAWDRENLATLKNLLVSKRDFLLRLLENPNLLEHETFTQLLWAVFHLVEELSSRNELSSIPDSDLKHLIGDINRVYSALTLEWLSYMRHLCADYPFLFSFAIRTNPFDINASPEV